MGRHFYDGVWRGKVGEREDRDGSKAVAGTILYFSTMKR